LFALDAVELFPEDDDEESITLEPEERKAVRKRLERANQLEKELREVREQLRRTEEQKRRLQEELKRIKTSAPFLAATELTAEAGGIPSSRIFYRRPARPREPNPTGAQVGHEGRSRERPVPNSPPLKLTLERCTDCGTRLGEPFEVRPRTITDIPAPVPKVFDVEIPRYTCPGCHRRVEPPSPYPANQQYGFALMARVVHLRMLGLSVPKVVDCLRDGHGVTVSPAAVLKMERSAAEALGPLYEGLKLQLNSIPVIHGDETSFRIGGQNGWMWVFSHLNAVVYRIAPSRGQDVVREMLEGFEGTLVHDAWDPYDCLTTAHHQLDLLHVNRWLERAEWIHRIEPRPLLKALEPKLMSAGRPPEEFLRFADGVRRIVRGVIHWSEGHPDASIRLRHRVERSARRSLTRHLKGPWSDPDAARIAKELLHRRGMLFTFVVRPGVPWHNNEAETQIRQGVLFRKVSGRRRSWMGAWVLERLMTVYRTCRKRGLAYLKVIGDALDGRGYPAFLAPSVAPES
jgi:transposase